MLAVDFSPRIIGGFEKASRRFIAEGAREISE
jgi:hypothetical protein